MTSSLYFGEIWTKERIELLKVLVQQPLSNAQIADQLGGGLTRNAVIGKRNRLGLDRPNGWKAPKSPRRRKEKPPEPIPRKVTRLVNKGGSVPQFGLHDCIEFDRHD